MKRIISLIMALVLLVGMLPMPAGATENNAQVTNDDVTIEGTNGFGNLLSEDIQQQYQRETEYSGAYSVTDLTIAGSTAVVEYGAMEEAILVVAIYSEDGLQMITSGKTTVSPDATEATVTISNMPQYFLASAFLVDTYDYSPLCDSYETPMYTQEMQELLASTIHDYDADRVLNLDADETTNFAVYAEDTIVVEERSGVNTIISANDETMTYVIGNADDTFLWLQPGDVVAYEYGDNQYLVVKVETVDVEGTTVSIQGAELEMNDVFSHVKLENDGSTSDTTVDTSSLGKGVTYNGLVDNGMSTFAARDDDVSGSYDDTKEHEFNLDEEYEGKAGAMTATAHIKGRLTFSLKIKFDFYIAEERQYVAFRTTATIDGNLNISGAINVTVPLAAIPWMPVVGVVVTFNPTAIFEVTAEVDYWFNLSQRVGFYVENNKGFVPIKDKAEFDHTLTIEGTIYLGFDLNPEFKLAGGLLMNGEANLPLGVELHAQLVGQDIPGTVEEGEVMHACKKCLDMTLTGRFEISAKLRFLLLIPCNIEPKPYEMELGKMYYSFDYDEFDWGTCPHSGYKVTVSVTDANGAASPGTPVSANGKSLGRTELNGVLETYLEENEYEFYAAEEGQSVSLTQEVTAPCAVKLKMVVTEDATTEETFPGAFGAVDTNVILAAPTSVWFSGDAGSSATYVLYNNGLMVVSGTGIMEEPMHNSFVKELSVSNGITGIADNAFYNCDNLLKVTLPDTLVSIGNESFSSCDNLVNIKIPDSVTSIGDEAFMQCHSLTSIRLPDSVTKIGEQAFYGCEAMTSVRLSANLTEWGQCTFEWCSNLTNLYIPEGVETIGYAAFRSCEKLKNVILPDSVSCIDTVAFLGTAVEKIDWPSNLEVLDEGAFANCKFKTINIPSSLTEIADGVFSGCSELIKVEIPDSIISIGDQAFSGCTSLEEITIPESVTSMGAYVFSGCESLTEVDIPNGVTSIKEGAFSGCEALNRIKLPEGVTDIGNYAFWSCSSLESIDLPSSVTHIGTAAISQSLKEIWFLGDMPACDSSAVYLPEGTGFFPAGNPTWTLQNMWNQGNGYGYSVEEWHPYTIDENGNRVVDWNSTMPSGYAPASDSTLPTEETVPGTTVSEETVPETTVAEETVPETTVTETIPETTAPVETIAETVPETTAATVPEITAETESVVETQPEETEAGETLLSALLSPFVLQASAAEVEIPNPEAPEGVFGGEYGAEDVGTYTLRTATFYDLVPGARYVLLDMVSISGSDPLTASNLLTIDQGTADSSGTLVFEYVQRQDYNSSYIVACGPSNQDLNEAFVIFPDMEATDELQAINPTVDYYGDILKEGQDYVLLGQVSFEEAGEYTCFVRGINQYTGLVKCTYTVGGPMRGDFNADEKVDEQDAIYLIWHTLFPETYPIKTTGDMNRDGKTNDTDAAYLLWHILFPETYPL